MRQNLPKVGPKFSQMPNKLSLAKYFDFLPKWRNFAKSCHTVAGACPSSKTCVRCSTYESLHLLSIELMQIRTTETCCKSTTIAQCIHLWLPACGHGLESQALQLTRFSIKTWIVLWKLPKTIKIAKMAKVFQIWAHC